MELKPSINDKVMTVPEKSQQYLKTQTQIFTILTGFLVRDLVLVGCHSIKQLTVSQKMANHNITNKHDSESSKNIFRYLCPSFLSSNDILQELQIRCFKIKGLEKKSKDELIQIFLKHLVPLPQRLFPNNHHGNLINKMILKENASSRRQQKHEEARSCLQYGFSCEQASKLSSKSPEKGNSERLKPPIDSSNIQNKRISFCKTSSSSSSLDKIVINSPLDRCERKGTDETAGITKVDLKRIHSETLDDDVSPSKKSRQRIAWP